MIFKHDASRIIQTCLKYGNEDQHKQITEELKGRLLEITKSHYAHFLAIKLFKYCKEKHVFLKELYGHFPELIKHKVKYSIFLISLSLNKQIECRKQHQFWNIFGQTWQIPWKSHKF